MAGHEVERRREHKRSFTLIFIINGQDYSIQVDTQLPLAIAVQQVLQESGNTGRPAEEWEVRDSAGALLETSRSPHALGLHNRTRLFLSLKVGAGGVGQNR